NLPRPVHEHELARLFLHLVGIDMAVFQMGDAARQADASAVNLSELLLLHGKIRADRGIGVIAARAADGVVAEIGDDAERDRRDYRRAEKSRYAPPDSHPSNESHTD